MLAMTFAEQWKQIEPIERRRLRRLVRLGRPVDDPSLEALASEYARYQLARPWIRLFWVWFVPGVFIALSIASQMHPVMLGVVLALAAQAVLANYNLRKTARLSTA
jgi:hypothetical protein